MLIDYVKLIAAGNSTFILNVKELPEDHVYYCHDDTSNENLGECLQDAVNCFILKDKSLAQHSC